MMNPNRAAQVYSGMGLQGRAEEATPHQLITMLFDGALDRLAAAKGAMQRNEIANKGTLISKAITIIDGLRAHLNVEQGGEIAINLKDLYDYMENRLLEANLYNNESHLDEVTVLIKDIREGWIGIAHQIQSQAAS